MNLSSASSHAEPSMLAVTDIDPFPFYDRLRQKGAVVWDSTMKCWLVLTYELCKQVESDESTFRITYADAPPSVFEVLDVGTGRALSPSQGERHARLRRLYLRLVGPPALPKIRDEHLIPVVEETLGRFVDRGSAELFSEFCEPITSKVMASLFGLPWRDDALLHEMNGWMRDIVTWIGMKYPEGELRQKAALASREMNRVLLPGLLERRANRTGDFVSQVWNVLEAEFGEVSGEDALAIVRELAVGAGENTANATANALYIFLTDTKARDAVLNGPERALKAFIEESLRLYGSIQWRMRIANKELSLGGTAIKKDDLVCMVHAAANRDADHYACPHSVDLERPQPTDHLAFNTGPRVCVGMFLSRLEMKYSLETLLSRLPNIRLDPSKEAPKFRDFYHRYFAPLHVTF